jgi:hypothetical protein
MASRHSRLDYHLPPRRLPTRHDYQNRRYNHHGCTKTYGTWEVVEAILWRARAKEGAKDGSTDELGKGLDDYGR